MCIKAGRRRRQRRARRVSSAAYRFLQFYPLTLPPFPPLGEQPVHIPLPIPAQLRQRLTNMAPNTSENIYLQLENVEAAAQPGVVWQTFVGPAAPAARTVAMANTAVESNAHFVGNVVLFGAGVRADMPNMPATLSFKINRALLASQGPLAISFVPAGILIDGKPSHPQVRSTVQIGSARIVVETIKQG